MKIKSNCNTFICVIGAMWFLGWPKQDIKAFIYLLVMEVSNLGTAFLPLVTLKI